MKIARTIEEHRARVAQLRALGYRVKVIKLPNGQSVTLVSKKRFVCRANHCTWIGPSAASVPWPKPAKKKRAQRKR